MSRERISVCICTYRRKKLLHDLLQALECQETEELFDYAVVVVDNDVNESGRCIVANFPSDSLTIKYLVEPTPNIAVARNLAIKHADGSYIAFIDDDELPPQNWLVTLFKTCSHYEVQGVLGPVESHFDGPPPEWLVKAGFYQRPRHNTGFVLGWSEARTGNVLIRRSILDEIGVPFRPEFGAGGEDQDFFRRMINEGHRFIWCDEAPVYELIPPHRWERRFLLQRALLRGALTVKHPGRLRGVLKSIIALPLYGLALPLLLICGQHLFMKYLVRSFDHLGRLLAIVQLNPVKVRCN